MLYQLSYTPVLGSDPLAGVAGEGKRCLSFRRIGEPAPQAEPERETAAGREPSPARSTTE